MRTLAPEKPLGVQDARDTGGTGAVLRPGQVALRTGVGLVACVLVLAGLVYFGGGRRVLAALASLRPLPVAAAGGLSLAGLALKFAKWQLYLGALGARLPWWRSLLVYGSGLSMVLTPGRAGELVKCALLQRQAGVPVSSSLPVILAERVTEGVALVIVGLAPVLAATPARRAFPEAAPVILAFAGVMTVGVVALGGPWASRLATALARRFPRLHHLEAPAGRFCSATRSLLTPRLFWPAAALSVASWGSQCLALQALTLGLGSPVSPLLAALTLSLATMAGTVSFIPAGLGAADASLAYLLTRTGAAPGQGAAAAVLNRLLTIWLPLLLGAAALGVALTLEARRRAPAERRRARA